MTDTQIKLGNALLKSLVNLKEKKGNLNIEDVGALFQDMSSAFHVSSNVDTYIQQEIRKMANYITRAMGEISSIPLEKPENEEEGDPRQNISLAHAELDAVVKATEAATNDILDAADQIQDNLSKGDKMNADAIMAATAKIYDACNFQDITGQRIAKVLSLLEFLETKLNNLKRLFDVSGDADLEDAGGDTRSDAALMRGPQLDTPDQEEIDKLFASLG